MLLDWIKVCVVVDIEDLPVGFVRESSWFCFDVLPSEVGIRAYCIHFFTLH